MLYWSSPPPIYPMTYIFRVYPREKTSGMYRYYTMFFWGNNGNFFWDGGNSNTYYGGHPYPDPPPDGGLKWEISVYANDYLDIEPEWDRWHIQVFRAWRDNATTTQHEFYYDWPDMGAFIEHEVIDANWADADPPSPAIVVGQAPDNGMNQSWGGYPGWEEYNGIIRGIQIYADDFSLADIASEIASPLSTAAGQASVFYINLNPTPTDVADDSGEGNNPSWDGAGRPTQWSGGSPDPTHSRMHLR